MKHMCISLISSASKVRSISTSLCSHLKKCVQEEIWEFIGIIFKSTNYKHKWQLSPRFATSVSLEMSIGNYQGNHKQNWQIMTVYECFRASVRARYMLPWYHCCLTCAVNKVTRDIWLTTHDLHNCSMYAESVLTAATLPSCSGPKFDLPGRQVTATQYTHYSL